MNILVINSGSTSMKFQIFDMKTKRTLCKGLVERIGIDGAVSFQADKNEEISINTSIPDHKTAIDIALKQVTAPKTGVLDSLSEINAVGHRIVHGGSTLTKPELITSEVEKKIEDNVGLAPLHNPAGLLGIRAVRELLPDIPHTVSFDTAYYSGMEKEAYLYALDYGCYENWGYRKFGFHGASHQYVNIRAAKLCGAHRDDFRAVSCHIGGGVSLAASIGCVGVDTSVGYGTVCGVPMGTRSGDVDPEIILQLIMREGMTPEEVKELIYKKSGLLGISGISSDIRDIISSSRTGNERAVLALNIFSRSIRRYVCALAASLRGRMDALIFTAGIGENSSLIRQMICDGLEVLGIELDKNLNENSRGEAIISAADSRVKVLTLPTDEELMIAMETNMLVNQQ
ncbi:MAG: acetate kinase [Spirochaetales bacterium]|nr:acetate kinase [Spirochaetales bacterium]